MKTTSTNVKARALILGSIFGLMTVAVTPQALALSRPTPSGGHQVIDTKAMEEKIAAEREKALQEKIDKAKKAAKEKIDEARKTAKEKIAETKKIAAEKIAHAKKTAKEKIADAKKEHLGSRFKGN